MPITVSSLIYYPIKACRGFEVESTQVERMGLQHDRRMMIVSEFGEFLTQREYPKLALITPTLAGNKVILSAPEFDRVGFNIRRTGVTTAVDIWHSKDVQAIDQGDQVAEWLTAWIGDPVRLVHIADGYKRLVNEKYTVNADDHTGFADGYPILLASEESLQDLNTRLEAPIPMNRFRPNVVVKGCGPYAEDTWNKIKIGSVELAVVKPCARCVVTTIDKETLQQSKEPLKTLGQYRKRELGAIFGQNVIPLNGGRLRLGMNVEVL